MMNNSNDNYESHPKFDELYDEMMSVIRDAVVALINDCDEPTFVSANIAFRAICDMQIETYISAIGMTHVEVGAPEAKALSESLLLTTRKFLENHQFFYDVAIVKVEDLCDAND